VGDIGGFMENCTKFRVKIDWKEVNVIKCVGVVTLDCWLPNTNTIDLPNETYKFEINVEKNTSGMSCTGGLPKYLFEDTKLLGLYNKYHKDSALNEKINLAMKTFYRGVCCEDMIFFWDGV
jgi:hypothetical protein